MPVHDRSVVLGHSLILQGHVTGHPRPAIVWQHPHGHALVDDGVNIRAYYGEDGLIQLQVRRHRMSRTDCIEFARRPV